MDWDKLRVFHAAAGAGSFTHAGEALGLSQSAVSRQVSGLEESLGVPLFHRHARGLILTEQGEMLYRSAQRILNELEATRMRLTDSREKPGGELRVTTTVGLGSSWLTPRLSEFLEMYPDINLSLVLQDEELDLSMREADIAIRLRQPTQPDPDPAAAVHRALPRLCLAGISAPVRHAEDGARSRRSPHHHLRQIGAVLLPRHELARLHRQGGA